jgi:hypothetical protein
MELRSNSVARTAAAGLARGSDNISIQRLPDRLTYLYFI